MDPHLIVSVEDSERGVKLAPHLIPFIIRHLHIVTRQETTESRSVGDEIALLSKAAKFENGKGGQGQRDDTEGAVWERGGDVVEGGVERSRHEEANVPVITVVGTGNDGRGHGDLHTVCICAGDVVKGSLETIAVCCLPIGTCSLQRS